jgi:hypothetical protein
MKLIDHGKGDRGMEELLKEVFNELREIKDHMVTRQEFEQILEEKSEETKSVFAEEMKRVADAFETVAVSAAAATKEQLENKVEAGDVLLKSLIDGLENRMNQRFENLENRLDGLENRFDGLENRFERLESRFEGLETRMNQRFEGLEHRMEGLENGMKQVLQGIEFLANNQQTTAEILDAFVARFEYQDELNKLLNERIKKQEEQTYFIRRKLKELGGDLDAR